MSVILISFSCYQNDRKNGTESKNWKKYLKQESFVLVIERVLFYKTTGKAKVYVFVINSYSPTWYKSFQPKPQWPEKKIFGVIINLQNLCVHLKCWNSERLYNLFRYIDVNEHCMVKRKCCALFTQNMSQRVKPIIKFIDIAVQRF